MSKFTPPTYSECLRGQFCVIHRCLCSPHQRRHTQINATYSLIGPVFSGVYHAYTTIICNLWLRRGAFDRCHFVCMWQKLCMYVVGDVSRVVCVGIVGTMCRVWITQGLASLFAWSNGTKMPNDGNQFLISVLLEKSGFQQHDVGRSRRRVT
jgi:hypothetical protein